MTVAVSRSVRNNPRVGVVCAVDSSMRTLLQTQMEAIRDAGYQVVGICSDGPDVPVLREAGLHILPTPILRKISPRHDMATVLRLKRIFRRLKLDIVHTHTPKASFLAQIAAKMADVPIRVNTIHGLYFYGRPEGFGKRFYKKMEVKTCRMATHVLSQSQEDVDLLLNEGLLEAEKIEWLGNGIDLERFSRDRFEPGMRQRVREELSIPDNAFVVGIVARMVREKGFCELFEAFAELKRRVPEAYLVHMGFVDDIRKEQVTPELAEQYGIAAHCRFLGQRLDVPRIMMAMDLYCLPSYREGYPRSVMEANAMGVPAVVSDIRGCREAVIEGMNGLIVPPKDAEALARAMTAIALDREALETMSSGARKRAESTFDERRVFATILRTYESLLSGLHI